MPPAVDQTKPPHDGRAGARPQRRLPRGAEARLAVLVIAWAALGGCAGPPTVRTTFLSDVDLVEMTDRMAESFVQAPALSERTADAEPEPWVISFNRMTNHTNEVIPQREKWLYVARLRALLAVSRVGAERNLIWIIPPKHWHLVADELGTAPLELRMKPTHQLSAEFAALTTTSGRGRSDIYLCEYRLVDLRTGRLTWTDSWEVKRAVSGRTYD